MSEVLSMSDEDFLQLNGPASEGEETPPLAATEQPEVPAVIVEEAEVLVPADNADEPVVPTVDEDPESDANQPQTPPKAETEVNPLDTKQPSPVTEPKDKPLGSEAAPSVVTVTPESKVAFYDKVMSGFKANGKQIELKSPEELIQLAQMGCNFTAKMQQIAPHRKVLLMLENNGLLDEGKLSYLIDLERKDPEAIKKLIKDSGMNPLDIDTEVEPTYREGNHRVGEEEVNFRTVLDDVRMAPKGVETLQVLNSTWDQASKDELFKNPQIMTIMHQQRELGVYDRIAAEIDRQRTLGTIQPTQPFVKAYEQVGKQMAAAGMFVDLEQAAQPLAQQPVPATPLATRAAAPKATVVHSDKASAAAASRTTPRQAKVLVNPLEMSDDEFLKQMNGRL